MNAALASVVRNKPVVKIEISPTPVLANMDIISQENTDRIVQMLTSVIKTFAATVPLTVQTMMEAMCVSAGMDSGLISLHTNLLAETKPDIMFTVNILSRHLRRSY
ncbi:uncharacterized protein LOC142345108 [Convolutriloba macropyga]|uniref:uncharacterized protein LOC142345108 n=1 Tax=Convolutriloba macropyga TaxID=536237 RepID=UPI003F51C43F